MSQTETIEVCPHCDHPIGQHFESVDGKVRCLHSTQGASSSGVIGLPWKDDCDCVDYVSPKTEARRAEAKRQSEERKSIADGLVQMILEKSTNPSPR